VTCTVTPAHADEGEAQSKTAECGSPSLGDDVAISIIQGEAVCYFTATHIRLETGTLNVSRMECPISSILCTWIQMRYFGSVAGTEMLTHVHVFLRKFPDTF
jgi:hypothetical protein